MKKILPLIFVLILLSPLALAHHTVVEVHTFNTLGEVFEDAKKSQQEWHDKMFTSQTRHGHPIAIAQPTSHMRISYKDRTHFHPYKGEYRRYTMKGTVYEPTKIHFTESGRVWENPTYKWRKFHRSESRIYGALGRYATNSNTYPG